MGYITEERALMRDAAARFTDEVVLPMANELDPDKREMPRALIRQMGDMGFFGIRAASDLGGSGLGCFEYCLVAEELGRGWMSVASIIARANTDILKSLDWPEQRKADYARRIVRGEFLVAVALSEPDVGSDLAAIACRADRDGDDYVLNGSKYWCTFADGADAILVFARTSPRGSDPGSAHEGISALLVEKPRGELPVGCSGQPIPKIGYHGWRTFELSFDACRVPVENRVGEEGSGFLQMVTGLEIARAHTAARAIGLAQGALDVALDYAGQREQFGRPLSAFQDIRFKLARMAAEIEAARQLNYSVCDKIDRGGRCDREASMSKWFATEMAERVTSEALQILGGAGYTTHFPVERYWRDARLTKIFEGTSEIQLKIISDQLLGR